MTEPDYHAERRLPIGLTCADCLHGKRCDRLFGAVRRAFTSCDFWPSRFTQGASAGTAETGTGSGLLPAGPVTEGDAP